jgi:hypothetical protein
MTEDIIRFAIVIIVFGGFIGFMLIVLLGFVNVESPELAKLVGAIFGYLTGLLSPIVARYFRNGGMT